MKASIGRIHDDYMVLYIPDFENRGHGTTRRVPRHTRQPLDWGTRLYLAFVLGCCVCIAVAVFMVQE